jgi:uncharacterized protein DUF4865
MLAMQYSFNLPADYDMAIIRRRIVEKGHFLDDFPGLAFKAYLHASRDDRELPSRDNLYAPFYLWRDGEAMNGFLGGSGFAALAQAFGRPSISTWSVWQAHVGGDLAAAAGATREIVSVPVDVALDEWRQLENEANRAAMSDGALAAVSAFEPTGWTQVRFRLWPSVRADLARDGRQAYRVGHVSQPGATR